MNVTASEFGTVWFFGAPEFFTQEGDIISLNFRKRVFRRIWTTKNYLLIRTGSMEQVD